MHNVGKFLRVHADKVAVDPVFVDFGANWSALRAMKKLSANIASTGLSPNSDEGNLIGLIGHAQKITGYSRRSL